MLLLVTLRNIKWQERANERVKGLLFLVEKGINAETKKKKRIMKNCS